MRDQLREIYLLCQKHWFIAPIFLVLSSVFIFITPLTLLVYYANIIYYFFRMFVRKGKKNRSYVTYSSERPLYSFIRYVFFVEPALRAFNVVYLIKHKRGKLGAAFSPKTLYLIAERFAIVAVSGIPAYYVRFILDILVAISLVRPKSLKEVRECIRIILAPETTGM